MSRPESGNPEQAFSEAPSSGITSPPHESRDILFKGVARHSLIYVVGILAGRAVSILMLPIYTRFLTPADYGTLALINLTLEFITLLAGAKLALGVFRFYHKAGTPRERDELVSTGFLLVGGMYSVVGLGTVLAAAPLSRLIFGSADQTILFQVAAGNVAFSALLIVPLALARVQDRSTFFVAANLIKLGLQVAFVVLFLVVMDLGVLGVLIGNFVANLAAGTALTVWLYRTVRLSWTLKAARDLSRYGLPLMATKVATFFSTFSDRFFLQAAADETVVGLYNLAYQFGFILVMLGFTPVDLIWGPKRFDIARQEDGRVVLSRAFVLINVLLISVAVAICLFAEDLLRVMATPEFYPAAQVVPILVTAYVLYAWGHMLDIGILVSERTEYVTFANFVASGVAVLGYWLLIPRFLAWGAAAVTLLTFVIQVSLLYAFSQRLWRIEYPWRPVMVLVAWAVLIPGAALALPEMSLGKSVALKAALGVLYLLGVWCLPILEVGERQSGVRMARGVLKRWWSILPGKS